MMLRSVRVDFLWFSFYIDLEFAGVHSKCFRCRLCHALFGHRNQHIIPEPLACGAFQSEVLK